jgi:hypothetical protein
MADDFTLARGPRRPAFPPAARTPAGPRQRHTAPCPSTATDSVLATAMAPRRLPAGSIADILFELVRVGQRCAAPVMNYPNNLARAPAGAPSHSGATRGNCLFRPSTAALAHDLRDGGHRVPSGVARTAYAPVRTWNAIAPPRCESCGERAIGDDFTRPVTRECLVLAFLEIAPPGAARPDVTAACRWPMTSCVRAQPPRSRRSPARASPRNSEVGRVD